MTNLFDFRALADQAASTLASVPGRRVTFVRLSDAPSDPARPWRGSNDSRQAPVTSVQTAVFIPAQGSPAFGRRQETSELVKRTQQVALVAPGGQTTVDLSIFDEVVDTDGSRWKITYVETLEPGDKGVRVLYQVGLMR